jgi:glycerol kinase
VEHDPEELWESQIGTARRAMAEAGVDAVDVAAIGISNQRETTLLWDRETGRPVCPAIVWQDRRTAQRCDELRDRSEFIRARTGLVMDAYFSATKLSWMLNHVSGAREAAEAGRLAFGTVDSFLLWRLTKGLVHATDFTNASRTMLFDIHQRCWSDDLLEIFDIPRAVLPEVISSIGMVAATSEFGRSIPIMGVAGDQQAAAFGQNCTQPGQVKATYGTGCFILAATATAIDSSHQLLTTITADGGFALEGSVFVAGAAIQWLRDGLGVIDRSEDSEACARSVSTSGGVTVVPAFTGLGAPHWDAYARGAIFGITRGTARGHIVRATLESIAFQCADVLEAMKLDGVNLTEVRVDGGAARNNLLMQFQADILNLPVLRPKITETTAMGAAYLAGLASQTWKLDERFEPQMAESDRESRLAVWRDAIRRVR